MDNKLPNDKQSAENSVVALKEVSARYRLLMGMIGDGMIIVQDHVIKEINPSMTKLSGYDPEAMMDTTLTGYFPPTKILPWISC